MTDHNALLLENLNIYIVVYLAVSGCTLIIQLNFIKMLQSLFKGNIHRVNQIPLHRRSILGEDTEPQTAVEAVYQGIRPPVEQ